MATQKTYLDTVLDMSSYGNQWLDAADRLSRIYKLTDEIEYTYIDDIATVEVTTKKMERFLIVFSWVNHNETHAMCMSVKTTAPIIGAQVLAHTYIPTDSSSITVTLMIGKLLAAIEHAVLELYKHNPVPTPGYVPTSLDLGTLTLSAILRLLVGKVYFDNFNHDWPNNGKIS